MWYAIPLAAIVLAYWVVRELILYTFKNAATKKQYIICFSAVGFSLAVAFVVAGQLMQPDFGMLMPGYGPLQLFLCPPVLLGLALMDVPHPSVSSIFILGLLMALMNSALYAAVGSRIGAAALKSKVARS
jgi:hypothetical protein